jgi:hypothetical protein
MTVIPTLFPEVGTLAPIDRNPDRTDEAAGAAFADGVC